MGDVDDDILRLAAVGAGVSGVADDSRKTAASTSGLVQSTAQLVIEEHNRRIKQQQTQKRRLGAHGRHSAGYVASGDAVNASARGNRAAPGLGVRLATSSGSKAFYAQTFAPSVQLERLLL